MKNDIMNKINLTLSDYFSEKPAISKIPAKELMDLFIRKGIFTKDNKDGQPIRKFLRSLDDANELYLIPYVHVERKGKNRFWYFVPLKSASAKIIPTTPVSSNLNKVIPKSMDSHYKNAFPPIVNEHCVSLILGSLPGDESLMKGEYYANARNGFWKIMGQLLPGIPDTYKSRCDWLLKNKIALWDVLENGNRIGSLDSNIKNGTPNDFGSFFRSYPNIKFVFFNGTKAKEDFVKHVGLDVKHVFELLPSSSSTRAMAFELKVKEWSVIVKSKVKN
jgi:hypoxanthine-DNA glycosylase